MIDSPPLPILELFDPGHPFSRILFRDNACERLAAVILSLGMELPEEYEEIVENVWVGRGTVIASSARLQGPAVIGRNVTVGPFAAIRGTILIGDEVFVGTSAELETAILFDEVRLSRKNCVNGGVLGRSVTFGSGAVLDTRPRTSQEVRSLGFVGDRCVVGENAVLLAGVRLGKACVVEPLSLVGYSVPARSRVLGDGTIRSREDV